MPAEFFAKNPQSRKDIFFKNARIIDPASGYDKIANLSVKDGRVADFSENLNITENDEVAVIDCAGKILMPGIVDIQVHFRDPGVTQKEDLFSGSKAAASGGVTSVVCQPNTNPVLDNIVTLDYLKYKAEREALCNIYVYAAITKNMAGAELSEMGTLFARDEVVGFTDDGLPVMNAHIMRRAFEYSKSFGAMLAQHAEDLNITNSGCINAGKTSETLGVPGILNASESVIVARDIDILRETGGKYHVLHVSTKESMQHIIRAKNEGLAVTCEVTPHHFTLTDEAVLTKGTNAKMNPPLRSEEDRQALIQALKDGYVDAIATDHAPHEKTAKAQPLELAPFGIIGLETLLPLSLELHFKYGLPLIEVLALLTYKPADVIGIERGRITKNAIADLCLIDLDKEWQLSENELFSKSHNTPFLQRKFKGKVSSTYLQGIKVFEDN